MEISRQNWKRQKVKGYARELEYSQRELELKEKDSPLRQDNDGTVSVRGLFNDSCTEIVQYRDALCRRRLQDILEKDLILEKQKIPLLSEGPFGIVLGYVEEI